FTATKPLPNWSPSAIRISHASYSAPAIPNASNSSSITVTFWPFGVASEYSCKGWRPTGSSFSWVGPEMGRFMLAKVAPLGLLHVHTFGGTYSEWSVISRLRLILGLWRIVSPWPVLDISRKWRTNRNSG